jgi:phosphonate transport system substrate-binding protein
MQNQIPQQLNVSMKKHIAIIALVIPTLLIISTGCTTQTASNNPPQPTPSSQASGEKESSTLAIAIIAQSNDAQQRERERVLAEYLTKTLKQPVSVQGTKDYNGTVDLLVEEKVQIAGLGPLTYIEAKQRNPQIEPIAASITKSTGRPWYKSAIIANSASGIKTIDDLKGKRLGFVSKLSTSGYMYPVVHLLDLGLNLDRDFTSVEFFKSHDNNLAALLDGKVDAVGVELDVYNKFKADGKINDTYHVIWESEPIPQSPIVVSKKLPPQVIAELKDAFIKAPIGMLSVVGIASNGYTLVQDSDYDRVRQVKKQLDEKLTKTK